MPPRMNAGSWIADQVRNDSEGFGSPYLSVSVSVCIPVFLFSNPFWMRRGAQGKADQGERLFERSEFELDPALHEHRRLPRRGRSK